MLFKTIRLPCCLPRKDSILCQNQCRTGLKNNAKFDAGILKKEGVEAPRVICTLKLIKTLDTEGDLESYKLQYLRYYYGMEIEAQAHDAWGDILVLEQLFIRIFKEFQKKFETPQEIIAEMIRISEGPVLMAKIPIGKHRGQHFRDVPKDYLQWVVKQEFDEDLLYTANHYLNEPVDDDDVVLSGGRMMMK